MEEKRAQFLAKLEQRRSNLQEKLIKKRIQEDTVPSALFQKKFNGDFKKIKELLAQLPCENSYPTGEINNLTNSMRKNMAEASQQLSAYEKRRAIQALRDLEEEIRQKLSQNSPLSDGLLVEKSRCPRAQNLINKSVEKPIELCEGIFSDNCSEPKWWEQIDQVFKIADLSNKTIELGSECNGGDISLSKLDNCKVYIKGFGSTIYATCMTNCTVVAYPVTTSVFVESCNSCVFCLACQQLRIHESSDSQFYIHVSSRAVMEHSKNLQFAPYTLKLAENESLSSLFASSGLSSETDNWDKVNDFDWPLKSRQSPNWSIISNDMRLHFSI